MDKQIKNLIINILEDRHAREYFYLHNCCKSQRKTGVKKRIDQIEQAIKVIKTIKTN